MFLKKTINIKLYDLSVRFIVTSDIESYLKKFYKKRNLIYSHTPVGGIFDSFDIDEYFMIMSKAHLSYNVILHELYHNVRRIGRDRNISNEESLAWIQGHIGEEIFKFLKSKEISL